MEGGLRYGRIQKGACVYFLIDLILNEILMEMESFIKLTSYAINYTREYMCTHESHSVVYDTLLQSNPQHVYTLTEHLMHSWEWGGVYT